MTAALLRPTPRHVAIIMDGNRRWAKRKHLPSIEGHRRGIGALREVTRAASDLGIEMLTVYGFSTENWKRDSTEISLLFDLCVFFARSELDELIRNDVRVDILGAYRAFPPASRAALERLVERTRTNRGLRLNLAVNYSGRADVRQAAVSIARDVRDGTLSLEAIDDDLVAARLSTADLPAPELLVRPGGESRLSNFLLYEMAGAEVYLTDVFWPDFGRAEFERAIDAYRERPLARP